ncbi:MAG: hypothetical protein H7Y13_05010 [Sphingobacteriaceae bacterium]|nr:hypothetical protein [Sphingobacteriaceae bacterium]
MFKLLRFCRAVQNIMPVRYLREKSYKFAARRRKFFKNNILIIVENHVLLQLIRVLFLIAKSEMKLFQNMLFLAIVFSIISCANPPTEPQVSEDMSKSNVNEELIPADLKEYIKTNLQGWLLAERSDYSKVWWSFYDAGSTPYAVVTDINDDQAPDYGMILKNNDALRFVIFFKKGNSYTHWVADNFNKSFNSANKDLQNGLTIEPPGRVDVVYPEIKSLILKSNAISVMELENRRCIYYWSNGKVSAFTTM